MAARIDIPSVYDEVRRAYAGMGYPVSGDRLVLSEQPTYVDGRPVPKDVIRPSSSGGNTQDDGTVRINPRYRAVMRHWGLKGSGRDFLRTIIGHELGHHVDRTVLSGRSAERRRLLREISRSGFHTGYTDSYGPDTDPRKLDKELLAEYLARQVSDRLGKSAAAAEFRDGTYDDVKAVYDALTDEEKDFVTPHRKVYKDVPPLARTVAYSGGAPVGFADLYGKKGRASLCLAVAKAVRGRGLAGEMARTSIRKLLNAMAEEKRKAMEAGGKELEDWRRQSRIRRFVWGLDARNDRSAHAAARAGFTEQEFRRPHKYRRFVMTRGEAERLLPKDMDFPAEEHTALAGRDSIVTHRVSDDARRFRKGDKVRTPWGDEYAVADRSDLKKVEDSPYYGELTDAQRRLLRAYRRIALLRLEKRGGYERPYNARELRMLYSPDLAKRLLRDPVHSWRAKTGIELLHREPTKEELVRIIRNWKLMNDRQKKLSDEKSVELFGKGNMDRVGELLALYEKQAAASDIEAKARLHYPAEGSHGWNHIQDVRANARRMRRRELRRNELAAIVYHDSSLMTGDRETHADDSAAIARKELAGLFRKRQLADIVNAIAHHRASYEGARNSRLEDLVAAADRPVPDLAKQVARSWKYHEELGEPEGLRAENVASHLKEKYGHGGYAYGNAPRLYLKTYGRELRDIMSRFDGLTPESVAAIVSGAEKQAGVKPPTSIETVRKLIGALKRKGLKRVSIAEIFASRPKYSLFRGSNALPAHAHRVPVKGEFARNLVDGVRHEHYTPFPDAAQGYGRYLTVTDISREKGLMSGKRGLTPDFSAMDEARMAASDPKHKALFGREYTKFITEHPEYFSDLHGITRGGDGKLKSALKPGGRSVRDNFFETTIPARYADKHSKVYMSVPGNPEGHLTLENGGLFIPPKSFIDEYRRLNPGPYADTLAERGVINRTKPFSTNRDYHFYDMSPIQRLVKIMHRHPEYRSEIEPVVSKYLDIDKSYMAGL